MEKLHPYYKEKIRDDDEFNDFCCEVIWKAVKYGVPALLALYGLICLIRGA